jgi:ABC-type nitrate/sulfonate/bicarbonate transport system substrate-binding protein
MLVASLAAAGVAAAGVIGVAPAHAATDVTILAPPIQLATLASGWAVDKGIFAKNGLNATLVTGPPTDLVPQLASGRVQFAWMPLLMGLKARTNAGVDLRLVAASDGISVNDAVRAAKDPRFAGLVDQTAICALPSSGIKRPKDLTGRSVGINLRGDSQELAASALIRKDGGDPSKVNWVVLGTPAMVAAVKNGTIDAGYTNYPYTGQCQAEGMKIVGYPTLALMPTGGVATGWFTTAEFAKSNPAAVKAFQKSIYQANAASHVKSTMTQMQINGAKYTKQPVEVALATPKMAFFYTTITRADVQRWATLLQSAGQVTKPVDVSGVLFPQPRS